MDDTTRLVLLRVPREFCNMVRCSITMLTRNISVDLVAPVGTPDDFTDSRTTTKRSSAQVNRKPNLVASVVSINGSARTAKLSTMARIRKVYRQLILSNRDRKTVEKLRSILTLVQNID